MNSDLKLFEVSAPLPTLPPNATKDGGFSYTQPTGDERFHNHPLSAENVLLSSNGRKNKLNSDDVEKIQKGIEQEIPTKLIQKLISAESGVNKLTVHDINNLRYKNTDRVNLRSDDGAKLLIHHIKSKGYNTAYRCDPISRNIDGLFFTNDTLVARTKRFSEVVVIDATYNTNDLKMPVTLSIHRLH
ncbi:hypothetical protein INT47_011422 [Mucor saturninus]|uniref:Uncharacterized protein n=1 Tax=Mucor saturninus TaxID=64648 RepID=A0A8H7QY30_9FUNG|nr:hypothetical protein INT47_011422 [Mucor saturninus]